MNMAKIHVTVLLLLSICFSMPLVALAQGHPNLLLTKAGVSEIRSQLGKVPLFDASVESARELVDAEIELGIDTPIPRDFSGGYTHKRHKRNYMVAQKAGALFQILQDEKYAVYVRDMLFQYEAMYKDLPLHPQVKSYARGKLFWQCLNESVWLLSMSQAYDAIYEWLSPEERERLEQNLFRPYADFISIENVPFYNRVHNHSTWGNAAVGMIGLVMDDEELIQRALYGAEDIEEVDFSLLDDDGGFIRVEGQAPGFLSNLEAPFSPDGYFTEGPYYQRYAMYPFLMFGLAMDNARPDMKVLEYKDGVLLKAVTTLLSLTDADGEFFPLNDAQKGMSYFTPGLIAAVDIAYHYGGRNPQLLSIAEQQGSVLLDQSGLSVAMGIRDGKAQPFEKSSINLGDGPDGTQGGVSVLRYGSEELTLVFKYTSQGLSHGHYDKLSFSLYEKGDEVLQDYGMVRFVNIQKKGGGNYLPERKTWGKPSIAHNTLTVNEGSHYGGEYAEGIQHHPKLHFFDATRENIQVVSATEDNAYPGTEMQRTMAVISAADFKKPFVLDILKVKADAKNLYDLPFHYLGQVLDATFDYESPTSLSPLGKENGYQHLYLEGKGKPASDNIQFSWMSAGRFYTLTSASQAGDEILFTRLGANDPEFNLRRDPSLIVRRPDTADTTFVSVIEPHGGYSPVTEFSRDPHSNIAKLKVAHDDPDYTAVIIENLQQRSSVFIVANRDSSASSKHVLKLGDDIYQWKGPYHFTDAR